MSDRIFISHATKDAQVAGRMEAGLSALGHPTWIAPRDVPPGSDYAVVIPLAIASCSAVILLVSGAAMDSPFVRKELDLAVQHRRKIFPIRIDDTPLSDPYRFLLANCQWSSATGDGLERVLASTHEALIAPHPAPTTPEGPQSRPVPSPPARSRALPRALDPASRRRRAIFAAGAGLAGVLATWAIVTLLGAGSEVRGILDDKDRWTDAAAKRTAAEIRLLGRLTRALQASDVPDGGGDEPGPTPRARTRARVADEMAGAFQGLEPAWSTEATRGMRAAGVSMRDLLSHEQNVCHLSALLSAIGSVTTALEQDVAEPRATQIAARLEVECDEAFIRAEAALVRASHLLPQESLVGTSTTPALVDRQDLEFAATREGALDDAPEGARLGTVAKRRASLPPLPAIGGVALRQAMAALDPHGLAAIAREAMWPLHRLLLQQGGVRGRYAALLVSVPAGGGNGLRPWDVVIQIDGKTIQSVGDVNGAARARRANLLVARTSDEGTTRTEMLSGIDLGPDVAWCVLPLDPD